MSHRIFKNDITFSNKSTEWHGMANVREEITREVAEPCLFSLGESIRSTDVVLVGEDEIEVIAEKNKTIWADLRSRYENGMIKPEIAELLPESPDCENKNDVQNGLLELSTMGQGYAAIENSRIWDSCHTAFEKLGVPFEVSTVGTLGDLRQFYMSILIKTNEDYVFAGDDHRCFLNMITSHDGTLACEAYDSMTRIVCWNTLKWSLDAADNARFKIKHTKNAPVEFENFELFLEELFHGRNEYGEIIARLASEGISSADALNFAKGYLAKVNKVKKGMELSTRSQRAAYEISLLFSNGKGNKGQTLNDLFNAGTEYWTHGSGTGVAENATDASRFCKSEFGAASDHKSQWFKHVRDAEQFGELVKFGSEFVLDKA